MSNFSCLVQFYWMSLFCSKYFAQDCRQISTSGSLWQFKRNEVPDDNADLSINNSQSFKYKAAFVGKTADAAANGNIFVKNTKIVVPSKDLSNFWRKLETPLINFKIHLELNQIEDCILSSARNAAKFNITDAKLHVPIVTLSTKDNVNSTKQLSKGFKISVFCNTFETKPAKVSSQRNDVYELLGTLFQGAERLFVVAYTTAAGVAENEAGIKNIRKYFLPKGEIKNNNID